VDVTKPIFLRGVVLVALVNALGALALAFVCGVRR
jgi:hypothetical protein